MNQNILLDFQCSEQYLLSLLNETPNQSFQNIYQANQINCQIITVPHDILKKIPLIGKNLDDLSLETVQTFLNDATKAGFKIKINK